MKPIHDETEEYMPTVLRVLSVRETIPSLTRLRLRLKEAGLTADLIPVEGEDADWSQILILHQDAGEIGILNRLCVKTVAAAKSKRDHLRARASAGRPRRAARWLRRHIRSVSTIYEIQPLDGAGRDSGWEILQEIRLEIWETARGILHTEGEGFTSPAGDLILWEYPSTATGTVPAAIRRFGRFRSFRLNVSSPAHRRAFLAGKPPPS